MIRPDLSDKAGWEEPTGPPQPGSEFPPRVSLRDGERRVVIGRIETSHGIGGEVRVVPLTDFPDRFVDMVRLRVRDREGGERLFQVEGLRRHKKGWLVKLAGSSSREDALLLAGLEIVITASELTSLPEDVFFVHQVIGLEVITTEGQSLGRVDDIIRTGSNDVYVTPRAVIPALDDVVLEINPEAGSILVRLVDGLLR